MTQENQTRGRERVTLLFVRNGHLLLFHRQRNGKEYYITPGGGKEPGETLAEAALREAVEETSLQVTLGPVLWKSEWEDGQLETAFLIRHFEGEPTLGEGPEKLEQSEMNTHRLEWHPLDRIPDSLIMPVRVDLIQKALSAP